LVALLEVRRAGAMKLVLESSLLSVTLEPHAPICHVPGTLVETGRMMDRSQDWALED
jgi:hypothetical protein